jgi:Ca-activated chloride channel family protein
MRGAKMDQARNALKLCLDHLGKGDRFAMIQFATTATRYRESLTDVGPDQLAQAKKWVDALEATGGTAINEALASTLELRSKDDSRAFTVVFFTDGQPTIGETNVDSILKNSLAKTSSNTRIFTFGVGDDVNAAMLDQLAERTRSVSTYVRPSEDIAAKAAGLYDKINHPVLANLKLTTSGSIALTDVYPPQLPDLFHAQQLVVLGRFTGQGPSALKLAGTVGSEAKEFAYDLTFPDKTGDERGFVEEIWARRKVGYMMDQIRLNGEKKELVDEVVALAKRYGITTPYTSWLIVPDTPMPVFPPRPEPRPMPFPLPPVLAPAGPGGAPEPVINFLRRQEHDGKDLAARRLGLESEKLKEAAGKPSSSPAADAAVREAAEKLEAFDKARGAFSGGRHDEAKSGKLGVDLAVHMSRLRAQNRTERAAVRQAGGSRCLEVGGVWIDEKFQAKMPTLVVKALSEAYFRILELQPQMKDVYRLGNHLVWVTPSGTALVIDASDGKDKLSDEEINKLFVATK